MVIPISKYKSYLAVITLLTCTFFAVFSPKIMVAEEDSDRLQDLQQKIEEYQNKINEAKGKQKTLASTIEVLNNQISLTAAKITKTKDEISNLQLQIEDLSVKIDLLDNNLNSISQLLKVRIEETYKNSFMPPLYLLVTSNTFSQFYSKVKYIQTVQKHDKELMYTLEEAKQNYDAQKQLKQTKQQELEKLQQSLKSQNMVLAQQKKGKEDLLKITKNDEKNFQDLLAKAKAEFQAIQSILAGKGDEKKLGDVRENDSIASIIVGKSACSTGTHLHFEIAKGGANTNPASYLSSKEVNWDLCGWYGCDEKFAFTGSWGWPVNGTSTITQGYGMTAYARSGAYGGGPHTGIDIVPTDMTVKSVKEGTLYRGSIPCGGDTLRYVRVKHKDSDISTYYLHIDYTR